MSSASSLRFSNEVPETMRRCVERCRTEPGLAAHLAARARQRFATYEGGELKALFLMGHIAPCRILLAGAGPGAMVLLKAIGVEAPGLEIIALIDRRAVEIQILCGYPVITAQQASLEVFDYVIVANLLHGKSMEEDLLAAGIAPARILNLHTLKAFEQFQERFGRGVMVDRILGQIRDRVAQVDNVILVPSRDIWSVVDESALVEALPAERTIRLYFGPPSSQEASLQFLTFSVEQSLPLLLDLLCELRPACVYVKGSAHFQGQHISVAIQQAVPDTRLVFEIYDYMCMFPEEILDGWGFDQEVVEDNRCAEAFMGLHADFIFDKTPGPIWTELTSTLMTAPRQPYFPRMQDNRLASLPGRSLERNGPVKLMCAGTIPEFKYYRPGKAFHNFVFQNIIQPIEGLAGVEGIQVDIFNSGHNPECAASEREYSGYRTVFQNQRVNYNAYIPFERLVERMAEFDFGIFLFAPTDMIIDFPLIDSLPNRFMGYITGDLPIIINKEMRYTASLVEAFNAGITVGAEALDELPRRILEADLLAMRKGARALHEFMIEENRNAIQAFKHYLAQPRGKSYVESSRSQQP